MFRCLARNLLWNLTSIVGSKWKSTFIFQKISENPLLFWNYLKICLNVGAEQSGNPLEYNGKKCEVLCNKFNFNLWINSIELLTCTSWLSIILCCGIESFVTCVFCNVECFKDYITLIFLPSLLRNILTSTIFFIIYNIQ